MVSSLIFYFDFVIFQIQEVREIISECSKSDIHLVLQYYEYDAARTIQAFMEGTP